MLIHQIFFSFWKSWNHVSAQNSKINIKLRSCRIVSIWQFCCFNSKPFQFIWFIFENPTLAISAILFFFSCFVKSFFCFYSFWNRKYFQIFYLHMCFEWGTLNSTIHIESIIYYLSLCAKKLYLNILSTGRNKCQQCFT